MSAASWLDYAVNFQTVLKFPRGHGQNMLKPFKSFDKQIVTMIVRFVSQDFGFSGQVCRQSVWLQRWDKNGAQTLVAKRCDKSRYWQCQFFYAAMYVGGQDRGTNNGEGTWYMMLHGPFQEVSQIWVVPNYVSSKFSHEEIAILGESTVFFCATSCHV